MASKFGLKQMRTTAERRASEASPVKVRAARNADNLPSAWDDKPRARQPRSDRYKNHRRARNTVILSIIEPPDILDTVDVA